jgi:uncharacterized membrane protein YkvA (DUF1232 family)
MYDRRPTVSNRTSPPPGGAGASTVVQPGPGGRPFPREDVGRLMRRMPAYARLAWDLSRDETLSRPRRLGVMAAAAYVLSPIDLVPGFVPVVGQLDDLIVAIAALRFALAGLSPARRRAHLGSVGLSEEVLAEDVSVMGDVGMWALDTGARTGLAVAEVGVALGFAVTRAGVHAGARGAGMAWDAARERAARRRRAGP